MSDKFKCSYCSKTFDFNKSLLRHLRNAHNLNKEVGGNLCCPFNNFCDNKVQNMMCLQKHLKESHQTEIVYEELEFPSMSEFYIWKETIEQHSNTAYVQKNAVKTLTNGTKLYLYCHRTGVFKSRSTGQRRIKSQGTNKIGSLCPSRMEVFRETNQEKVKVMFWKTHIGHTADIGRIQLSSKDRMLIADKLAAGVTFKRILKDIRTVTEGEELSRIHLTNNQDLRNIERYLNRIENKYQSNDVLSVKMLMASFAANADENPIIYYKPQGSEDTEANLSEDDFMIIIMTTFQKEMIKKFGNDKICLDSTHGTNMYRFQVTTLLIVDEYASGCPGAFCISNRVDATALKHFFQILKNNIGLIHCKVFMTDDAPAFYNAWVEIMDVPDHHLLCTWHIDKNWRENLSKIKINEKKALVYKALRVLLTEPKLEVFNELLQNFLEDLLNDPDFVDFHSYFSRYYASRPQLWAYCHRLNLGINTNMYLESLHKVLKYTYLDGKKNRRLYHCIQALLSLARDKVFERIIKMSKNKPTKHINMINDNHSKGEKLDKSKISFVDPNTYTVPSEKDDKITYEVIKENDNCENCPLKCIKCQICIHSYSCTCLNFLIHSTICKHIHACIIEFEKIDKNEQNICTLAESHDINVVFETLKRNEPAKNTDQIMSMAHEIKELSSLSPNLTGENREKIMHHMQEIINIYKKETLQTAPKPPTLTPSNAKIEPQRKFVSAKRKGRKNKIKIMKPNSEEVATIAAGILGSSCISEGNATIVANPHFHDHTYS